MMRPGCFMASIDLKDAFYSVPIHKDHQKYLKFQWRGKLYQYTCFPNGLAIFPRKFTKLLKPVFSNLRSIGHLSVIFINDSYLQGADFNLCVKNVKDTITLLDQVDLVMIMLIYLCYCLHAWQYAWKPETIKKHVVLFNYNTI